MKRCGRLFALAIRSQQSSSIVEKQQLAPAAAFVASGSRWFNATVSPRAADPRPVPLAKLKDNFLDGTSSSYLEELEERFRADPTSVDKTWASFFTNLENGVPGEAIAEAFHNFGQGSNNMAIMTAAAISNQTIQESMRLLLLVRAYQVNGHYMAKLDPLGLDDRPMPIELDPALYGFTDKDLDREFFLGTWNMKGFLNEDRPVQTLRQVLTKLQDAYCSTIGYEYMHIPNRDQCNWLRERIESSESVAYTTKQQLRILDRLAWSELFEGFLANKYAAAKRFGLEGCETLVPGMKALIDEAAERGVENICIGMPHRGRLNVLGNVVRKPMRQIFTEFTGVKPSYMDDTYFGSGDVKYHMGTSYDRPTANPDKRIHLSLLANPSHLEAVDPIVLGKVRAKQYYSNDVTHDKTMGILLHGDGSFSGQGVVYETLDMSALTDYTVGGTIHLVVNNQVAFTTDPRKSRSSPYCTDVAKALNCPIIHVNGDDVEAVVRACELAVEWRQTWKSDVVVDIVCYRKFGHNEIDEPMFTQPKMYKAIKQHPSPLTLYRERLLKEGTITMDQMEAINKNVLSILQNEFESSKDYVPEAKDWLSSYWTGFMGPHQKARIRNTGVAMPVLMDVGRAISLLPEGHTWHRQIKRVYEQRRAMMESGEGVDWAMSEALAFGTLVNEGNHVRLSGQDVERGTFSHRHAVIHDQETGEKYIPIDNVYPGQKPGVFTVSNSPLSEFGVLGYELGYALENPNSLVLWEAQFGDFANGAQVIFDQFFASGEAKWMRQCGLTVLLPHGYDGQGPEHSSARMERYLQMSDEDPYIIPPIDESPEKWGRGAHLGKQMQNTNFQLVNCTTPANYFHVLRRQIHRQFRKPLVIISPKNLLRLPQAKSPLAEFDEVPDDKGIVGVRFKRVIMDESATDRSPYPPAAEDVKRLLLCSGKLYYELNAKRAELGSQGDIAIVRIEQLAPFPFDLTLRELRRYPNAEVMWVQEEPMNMGAYAHVAPRLQTCMREEGRQLPDHVPYAGRGPAASTATGFGSVHKQEQAQLIDDALDLAFDGLRTNTKEHMRKVPQ